MLTEFDKLYSNLNKAQKQAVDAIEGPVMVIAGPGTGKTTILTLRIANILRKTDTAPENILALTFTESGAYNMRKKLLSIIGPSAYKVNINTFHGFCNEVIKEYPEKFPRIIGSKSITDIDQISILEKIIDDEDLSILRPFGDIYHYVKPSLSEIKNLKKENIDSAKFEKIVEKQEADFDSTPDKVHEKGAHKGKMKAEFTKLKTHIEKNKEFIKIYKAYEKALDENKFYDYEDMIMEVVKVLEKNEEMLLILQENYQYILADEHQDANKAQNRVLELLSDFHDNPNLFIVGDEKQAIFRFQGASLDNFFYFRNKYKNAVQISLEENYRSTQDILDASHSLILNNKKREGYEIKNLKALNQKNKELIRVIECETTHDELHFLLRDIQEKIKKNVNIDEIAVLYRDNKDAIPVANLLKKNKIPFRIESENDILQDEQIHKLLLILEAIHDLNNEEKVAKILFLDFLKNDILKVYEVLRKVQKEKQSLVSSMAEHFPDFLKKISSWASASHNKPFIEVLQMVIVESGFLEMALSSEDSIEIMSNLETFFFEMKNLANAQKEYYLNDFITHLEMLREHGITTRSSTATINSGIRLMTAHKSKGLEFEYVYVTGAFDGHWGNKIRRNTFHTIPHFVSDIDDERRLFYVALTRAKKGVTISYPKQSFDGKELLPSQFIGEISNELKKVEIYENKDGNKLDFISLEIKTVHKEIKNKKYLQELFVEQGLSVTALNNYIKCPWDYFFINLIRIPRVQTKHQVYGTAIHETLRTFFNKYREEEDMSLDDFLSLFEFNLQKGLLNKNDLRDSLKKGKDTLTKYYKDNMGKWNRNLLTEYNIGGVHLNVGTFDLLLKGNLDKIEFINDREVNVVDYKTGKKKTENKENYKRQLIFYKLLLDLDDKKKYIMKTGELDYIEMGKKEKYEISSEEVKDLVILIKEKANEIYNLDFWNKSCDDKDCEYCKLGKIFSK